MVGFMAVLKAIALLVQVDAARRMVWQGGGGGGILPGQPLQTGVFAATRSSVPTEGPGPQADGSLHIKFVVVPIGFLQRLQQFSDQVASAPVSLQVAPTAGGGGGILQINGRQIGAPEAEMPFKYRPAPHDGRGPGSATTGVSFSV